MAAAAASAESNIYLPQATQPSITNEVHPCPQDEPPISKHLTRSVTRTEGSELDCHHFTSTKLDADLIRHEMYNSKQLSETLALSNASCSSSSSFVAISAASSIAQHLATEPNILPKDTNQTDVNDEIAIEEALGADVSSHGDTDYLLGGELEDVDVETDCQTSLHSAAEEVDTGSLKSLLKGPSEKELGLFVTKFTTVDLSEDKEQGSIEGEGALLKKRCVEYAVFQRECESFNTNLIVSEEHYSIIESLEGQLASHVRRQSSALTNEITKKMNTPTTDD
ncbi:unnamed protein product [Protopolystoma xenopodis]|uniref:Uncharacterized protein n=1 Tax=Protopolystoma xenopodis TaxID=117903 RepID=A0A3S5CS95_9PLAT|nr:unnamed protein product [Protopolystoma xenopodis]